MPDDLLSHSLDRWTAAVSVDPAFEREVWRRIAIAENRPAPRRLTEILAIWFSRPSIAGLFAAGCVVAGLFLAELRVARAQQQHNALLAHSYLRLIDPLLGEPAFNASSVPPPP